MVLSLLTVTARARPAGDPGKLPGASGGCLSFLPGAGAVCAGCCKNPCPVVAIREGLPGETIQNKQKRGDYMAKEEWLVFKDKDTGRELLAYTIRGTFPGEKEATIEQLAFDNGIPREQIITERVKR